MVKDECICKYLYLYRNIHIIIVSNKFQIIRMSINCISLAVNVINMLLDLSVSGCYICIVNQEGACSAWGAMLGCSVLLALNLWWKQDVDIAPREMKNVLCWMHLLEEDIDIRQPLLSNKFRSWCRWKNKFFFIGGAHFAATETEQFQWRLNIKIINIFSYMYVYNIIYYKT